MTAGDSYWAITASGGSANTLIRNTGGYSPNTVFGVYSGSSTFVFLEILLPNTAGKQAFLSIIARWKCICK